MFGRESPSNPPNRPNATGTTHPPHPLPPPHPPPTPTRGPDRQLRKEERAALVEALTAYPLAVSGHEGYKKAEVRHSPPCPSHGKQQWMETAAAVGRGAAQTCAQHLSRARTPFLGVP